MIIWKMWKIIGYKLFAMGLIILNFIFHISCVFYWNILYHAFCVSVVHKLNKQESENKLKFEKSKKGNKIV